MNLQERKKQTEARIAELVNEANRAQQALSSIGQEIERLNGEMRLINEMTNEEAPAVKPKK